VLVELTKVEQRYDAVLAVIRDGLQVREVAEKFGVSRQTVHVWMARYEAEGLTGLAEQPSSLAHNASRPGSRPRGLGPGNSIP
jgi:transposase